MRGGLSSDFAKFSGMGAGTEFPDPFCDVASLSMPTNLRSALYWSEFIWGNNGTYRMAMERMIAYFLTEIEINHADDEESEKWLDFHDNTANTMSAIQHMLRSRMCYGNGFASVLVPFKRFLSCPRCGFLAPLGEIYDNPVFAFEFTLPEFHATCPSCKTGSGYRGKWIVKDEADDEAKKIKVKLWNPHEIELLHCPFTDDTAYLWRIPEDYKASIRQKNLYHLERVSLQVLEAIAKNQMFRFKPDAIFHMKEPVLAGIQNRGWGIPRVLTNFRQIWYVQVLRRFNEAIALDYVIPWRVITPAPRPGATGGGGLAMDPLAMFNGGDFGAQIETMVKRRRIDPASVQVLPFPVNFQMFGADANQLAPRDLLDQGMETMLNETGTPVELYQGSLQLQAAPVALRLFEATNHHLVHDANAFLRWFSRQVGQILSWEVVDAKLKRVVIADDLEKQMMAAQLMMSQQLSGTTVMRDFGYNWRQEQKQIVDESQYQQELQARAQEEMQQAGFAQQIAKGQDPAAAGGGAPAPGGAAPAGGDPAAGGAPPAGPVSQYLGSMSPSTPVTPDDMMAVAQSLATELLGQPESIKDSELRKLKVANPVLHSVVKATMNEMRQGARQQAGNAAVGQMQQQAMAG